MRTHPRITEIPILSYMGRGRLPGCAVGWAPGLSGVVGSAGGPGSRKLSQGRNGLSRLQKDWGAHWGHSRASRSLFSLSSVTTPDMVFYGHYPLDVLKCSG